MGSPEFLGLRARSPLSEEEYGRFVEEATHALATHPKVVLYYSGGKDSMCCLHLLRPLWDRITVVWMNAGAPYPETIEHMARVRSMVPHFEEVTADVLGDIAVHGTPVDVIPVRNTWQWHSFASGGVPLLQDGISCCNRNRWMPLHEATVAMGATLIVSGQRASEGVTRANGFIDGAGIAHWLPIVGWSDADVFAFLASRGVELPPTYLLASKSFECRGCVAMEDDLAGLLRYLTAHHPEIAEEARRRIKVAANAARDAITRMEAISQ